MKPLSIRLGDLLVEAGAQREDVERAAENGDAKDRLGERLVRAAAIDEHALYRALSRQSGVPLADLDQVLTEADPTLIKRVSRRFLDTRHVVPWKCEGGVVSAVSTEPHTSADELAWALCRHCRIAVVEPPVHVWSVA